MNDMETVVAKIIFGVGKDGFVYVRVNSGQWKLHYIYRDYQGSVTDITDASGTVVHRMRYSPWGKLLHTDGTPYTRSEELSTDYDRLLLLGRGYTGHEYLPWFGLVNVNARLYDPAIGRFLSPDPYVQMPDFSQNFNRYSYCLNNPLKFTDPSGEFFFSFFIPGLGTFIDAACWGAVIGGATYTASVAMSSGGFSNWNWGDFGKSLGIGAFSGVFTAGIGSAFGAVGSMGGLGELGRAFSHGIANGMISGIGGGNFLSGFAAGGLSSLAGSAFQIYGGNFADSHFGTYIFSGAAGGIAAELTGGNFLQGAAIGLMTAGLNHLQQGINKLIYNKTFNRIGYVPLDEKAGYQMANYKMRLRIWVNREKQLSIMAESYNTPVDGEVVAKANATLFVNNKQAATQALLLKRDYIYPMGGLKPLGEACFQVPTSGNISINFRGGWTVYMPGGAVVPVFHPIFAPVSININHKIVIY